VINYIAACNDSCVGVDATKLRFVKISEKGWIDSSMEEGYWAADELRQDDSSWNITIPKSLKSGAYVLRTEIIALHQAHLAVGNGTDSPVGAEFYPQCISLKVAGNGTRAVEGGVDARKLYRGLRIGVCMRGGSMGIMLFRGRGFGRGCRGYEVLCTRNVNDLSKNWGERLFCILYVFSGKTC
jgi:cellulase